MTKLDRISDWKSKGAHHTSVLILLRFRILSNLTEKHTNNQAFSFRLKDYPWAWISRNSSPMRYWKRQAALLSTLLKIKMNVQRIKKVERSVLKTGMNTNQMVAMDCQDRARFSAKARITNKQTHKMDAEEGVSQVTPSHSTKCITSRLLCKIGTWMPKRNQ